MDPALRGDVQPEPDFTCDQQAGGSPRRSRPTTIPSGGGVRAPGVDAMPGSPRDLGASGRSCKQRYRFRSTRERVPSASDGGRSYEWPMEAQMTAGEPELIEEMFVQVARGAVSADGVLKLTGLAPTTLYFSDRPERVVGHMTTAQFVDQWAVGDNSFASDPPNAVLSFMDDGGTDQMTAWWCSAIRRSTGIRCRTPSRFSRVPFRSRPVRARCSSIRSVAHCPQCRSRVCTVVIGAAIADGDRSCRSATCSITSRFPRATAALPW